MIFTTPSSFFQTAKRIISLVPSITELLYDLGLNDEVAGITKFCIHPKEWFHSKARVGGTKNIHPDIVRQLQPDLIIANMEENEKAQIEMLADEFNIYLTDIKTLEDALNMIIGIGQLVGKSQEAEIMTITIKDNFNQLKPLEPSIPAAYFIWRDPYIVAGGDTFIHTMMTLCGFKNSMANTLRYPEISTRELSEKECKLLLLSSEPYPFKENHSAAIREHFPGIPPVLVDGEMFSWYGSRLLKAPSYFQGLIDQLS